MAIIKRVGLHRIATIHNKQSVTLDFNPLLLALVVYPRFVDNIATNFLFSHWNKILALPAYYCPQTEEYIAIEESKINIDSNEHYWLGVDRETSQVLPTCVLVYPNAVMTKENDTLRIYSSTKEY